ncbi:MAG: PQQ-dependent sugar dehydrogenase [Gemmatimonadetes bacterium]|nr:PQQ-dependent sugar dehydrogenase [Gemmatimonadota bacterium]
MVADSIGQARQVAVRPNGDVFVAVSGRSGGGVVALRDTTGDGIADVRERFGPGAGGNGIAVKGDWLYFAPNDAVVRYSIPAGALKPTAPPDTIVAGLPASRGHVAKSIAFGSGGALYVNIGSQTNSCQEQDRQEGSPGRDPCTELETRGGIWGFDPDRKQQTEADGKRYATGLRNTVALFSRPSDNQLFGLVHGRDGLFQQWGKLFTAEQSAELPAEIFVHLDEGDDYGWPYCYYDHQQGKKMLNPEYGGDGKQTGRCEQKKAPLMGFPGHWAPNGGTFYTGSQFPAPYRGGVFVAFHGSWNREPLAQQGYKVVFIPFEGAKPTGKYETFADGFAGTNVTPRGALHRPVGVAQGPDGSLYVTDDQAGRIYRIVYRGATR